MLITFFILVLTLVGVAAARGVGTREDRRFLVVLFLTAFVLRLLFALFLTRVLPDWVDHHPNLSLGYLGDDGRLYHHLAVRSVQAWDAGRSALAEFVYWRGASSYILMHAAIYRGFGADLFAVGACNAFLGALVPVFTYGIAYRTFSPSVARVSALMVAFYPEQIVYAGSNLKDISVTAALTMGLWAVTRLQDAGRGSRPLGPVGALALAAAYLSLARFYLVAVLVGALLMNRGGRSRIKPAGVIRRVAVAAVVLVMGFFLLKQIFPRSIAMFQDPLTEISGFYSRMVRPREGSVYAIVQPPLSFIFLPVGVLLVLITPLPLWAVFTPDPSLTLLLPAMAVWYVLLPFVLYGMWISRSSSGSVRMLLWATLGVLILLAASGSGLVTTGRTRLPVQPVLLMFAAVGLRDWVRARRSVRLWGAAYTVVITATMLLYVWVR